MSSTRHQPSRLRGWLDWVLGSRPSPPAEAQPSEATVMLASIGATMDRKHIPTEIRLEIFGHVLQNEPAWDISSHGTIPDWVTPDLEDVWFRNTNFFLPVPRGLGRYQFNTDVTLEANTINFLARLRSRRNSHPVAVEVILEDHANVEYSQVSFHRLFITSYHLGDRQDLLDMKIVIKSLDGKKYDASPEIERGLKTRLLRSCAIMKKFKDGNLNMKEVFAWVGAVFDPSIAQVFSPESLVARMLSREISRSCRDERRIILRVQIIEAIRKAREDRAEEEG